MCSVQLSESSSYGDGLSVLAVRRRCRLLRPRCPTWRSLLTRQTSIRDNMIQVSQNLPEVRRKLWLLDHTCTRVKQRRLEHCSSRVALELHLGIWGRLPLLLVHSHQTQRDHRQSHCKEASRHEFCALRLARLQMSPKYSRDTSACCRATTRCDIDVMKMK